MKLKCREYIGFYEGQITASLEEKVKNNSLKNLLFQISDQGLEKMGNDETIKAFLPGLKANFIKTGLLNKDGTLTETGKEIIKTGFVYNKLRGAFDISFVENDGYLYVIKYELTKENNNDRKTWENNQLPGKFGDREYRTFNKGIIKNVVPMYNQFLQKNKTKPVQALSTYDFNTKECKTDINTDNCSLSINTTSESKFRLLDENQASAMVKDLGLEFELDDKNQFWLNKPIDYILQKPESENLLKQVYKNGYFNYKNENTEISKCRLNLAHDHDRIIEVLNHYLMTKVESSYLGYNEIGRLIMDFPELFENRPSIKDSTENIYNKLKETARKSNKMAYKRLQAYQDLCPDIVFNDYITKSKIPIDYTGKEKNWSEIVNEVFGNNRDIKSVTTLSKYVYTNKFISKNFGIISDCLQDKGVKLNVIFSENNHDDGNYFGKNNFLDFFNTRCKAIKRQEPELKGIHDRYWKITRSNSVEWFKSSGEVDALRFNLRENPNPDKNTKGIVKEMTITFIEESGVPDNVKKLFAECEKQGTRI